MISREALSDALHVMFELSPTALSITTTGRPHSRYVKVNSAYLELIGKSWEEIEGASLVTTGTAITDAARARRHHLLDTVGFYKLEEANIKHASGRIIPTLISAQRLVLAGQEVDIEIIIDNSDRKALEREIRRIAFTDPVTGMPNRSSFDTSLAAAVASWGPGESMGLAYIDLNGFKTINDWYGHSAGDALLRTIGERLQSDSHTGEIVARLGGDEFVMLFQLLHAQEVSAERFQRLAESLCSSLKVGEADIDIGVAIGVATVDVPVDPDTLMRYADRIMYDAKSTGERMAVRLSRFRVNQARRARLTDPSAAGGGRGVGRT